jgi:hypothetical protein
VDPLSSRNAAILTAVSGLVALQLADELRATSSQAGDDGVDVFDGECDGRMPGVFAGAWERGSGRGAQTPGRLLGDHMTAA